MKINTDIHNHSLFGVDDGPKTLTESLEMLKAAYDSGTRRICLTPHFYPGLYTASAEKINENFLQLREAAEIYLPKLKLYLGNEIMYHEGICESLASGRCRPLNGGKYVLVEFTAGEKAKRIEYSLNRLTGDGYRCILAHVERYRGVISDKKLIRRLNERGVLLQTNACTLTDGSSFLLRRRIKKLLKDNLILLVATDAHSPELYDSEPFIRFRNLTDVPKRCGYNVPLNVLEPDYEEEE